MPKILVYTPTHDDLLRDETVASIEAQQFDGELDWVVSDDNPYPGRDMRNVCAQYQKGWQLAVDGDYDALMCAEHDMSFPVNCIQALWDTPAPVIYALYMLRHGTNVVNLFRKESGHNVGISLSLYPRELQAARKAQVIEVSGAGFGATLIRRDVLQKIPVRMGENAPDLPFAGDCVRAGIKQMGRLDVACGHIHDNVMLDPYQGGGVIARVYALTDVTVSAEGSSMVLKRGKYYTMPTSTAVEHARAGYVRISNEADAVADEMETATDVQVESRETPEKKTRTRRKKAGD